MFATVAVFLGLLSLSSAHAHGPVHMRRYYPGGYGNGTLGGPTGSTGLASLPEVTNTVVGTQTVVSTVTITYTLGDGRVVTNEYIKEAADTTYLSPNQAEDQSTSTSTVTKTTSLANAGYPAVENGGAEQTATVQVVPIQEEAAEGGEEDTTSTLFVPTTSFTTLILTSTLAASSRGPPYANSSIPIGTGSPTSFVTSVYLPTGSGGY